MRGLREGEMPQDIQRCSVRRSPQGTGMADPQPPSSVADGILRWLWVPELSAWAWGLSPRPKALGPGAGRGLEAELAHFTLHGSDDSLIAGPIGAPPSGEKARGIPLLLRGGVFPAEGSAGPGLGRGLGSGAVESGPQPFPPAVGTHGRAIFSGSWSLKLAWLGGLKGGD